MRRRWEELLLVHFVFVNTSERVESVDGAGQIAVQTYLDGRRRRLRFASLHAFEASFCETPPECVPRVCFQQPAAGEWV
ncbi:MAG: hypothetical protein HYV26_08190 [Candidatus Hydrogenedentes bacterium]|nr:hypothetical protein [Candidatus Hydrogenedentota bacterium]